MSDFDRAADAFTEAMTVACCWKHHYYGAAYATRLHKAIKDARAACNEMDYAYPVSTCRTRG
jgi:hypothetical protein